MLRGPIFGRYHPDMVLITALTGLPGEVYTPPFVKGAGSSPNAS